MGIQLENACKVSGTKKHPAHISIMIIPFVPLVKSPVDVVVSFGSDLMERAASGGLKQDLSSLPRNGAWGAWMKTRTPSY